MTEQFDSFGIQFNLEMTKYAFDCMRCENSVTSAISKVLQRVGTFYRLSHIMILEKASNLQCFNITHEWCSSDIKPMMNHIITYSDGFKNYFFNNNQVHEIVTAHDIEQYDQEKRFSKLLQENNVTQLLCLGLVYNNRNYGLICFETKENINEYSENQIACFWQTKYLIEQFFMKMQRYNEYERKLEQVTLYDPITGLIKYDVFLKQAEAIYQKDTTDKTYIILYADLDSFKFFNERYGYAAGDDVLRMLEQHFMSEGTYHIIGSRLFSDYFVALSVVNDNPDESRIIKYIETQNRLFTKKIQKNYQDSRLEIVTGICFVRDKQQSIKTYIDNANQARKLAKKMRKCCVFYSEEMAAQKKKAVYMASCADDALKNNEFFFLLQPKTDLITKKVVGAEALIRWRKKDGTIVYPNEFISLFEETGFIVHLDFYVYNKVCEYLYHRIKENKEVVPVSVNVSRIHLSRTNFVANVIKLVDQYKLPHELLEFELTESVFLQKSSEARDIMKELKKAGFKVSMDDFGSGYSSLNLLTTLDFDILKLDKEFLSDKVLSAKDKVVINSIIQMAKLMSMTVLCEGVETQEQVEDLAKLQCDLVQGYYFGKPMPVEEFDKKLI